MKIKCFSTLTNVIQKFEQVKLKNLLLGEKNYLLSLKKLVLNPSDMSPVTRQRHSIRIRLKRTVNLLGAIKFLLAVMRKFNNKNSIKDVFTA